MSQEEPGLPDVPLQTATLNLLERQQRLADPKSHDFEEMRAHNEKVLGEYIGNKNVVRMLFQGDPVFVNMKNKWVYDTGTWTRVPRRVGKIGTVDKKNAIVPVPAAEEEDAGWK